MVAYVEVVATGGSTVIKIIPLFVLEYKLAEN